MPQSTDTKQEAGTVSNSSSTDLLAELVEVMEEMEFMACLEGRHTFYKKLDPVIEKATKHLIAQGATVAEGEARNRPFFRG